MYLVFLVFIFKIKGAWHEGSMIGVQCQLVICRGPLYLPKGIFATYGFVVNQDIVIFFDGPLLILCLDWKVKNDASDQYFDSLGVCNVKIRKSSLRWKQGTFL